MTASPFLLDARTPSQTSLTLYAESKKTGVSLRIAALLNAGVRAFRCLLRYQRWGQRGDNPYQYLPLVTVSFCPRKPLSKLTFTFSMFISSSTDINKYHIIKENSSHRISVVPIRLPRIEMLDRLGVT